ncbi:MAG: outer membrane beta-barrel protein [Xanthobacteraceae bacterium]|nr:outer membrane beta-barrel protein [Xanthobacteraceae bacterium]
MKRLLLAAALAVAITPAHAADLAPRLYTKAPDVAAVDSWTGFYVGGELGGRWSGSTWTTTALEDPVSAIEFGRVPQGNPAGFNPATVRAGGYAGYNWQFAPAWVVGLEGDLAWGDGSKSIAGIPGTWWPATSAATIALDSTSVRETWDGAIRARLGWLITPGLLLFGTGGVAWQDVSVTANCSVNGPWCVRDRSESFGKVMTGWTVGGGAEAKLAGNWLARIEYRYADFGSVSHEFFPQTVDSVFMRQSVRTQTVSVGFAHLFGDPAATRY